MPIPERFGYGLGTTLGVQVRAISNITTATITAVSIRRGNLAPERIADIVLSIDNDTYTIHVNFLDETLQSRTITGASKQEAPE